MRGPLIETESRKIFNQGVSEGIDKNRKKTALKLLNRRKMTVEEIAEDTGLSVAEVEQLADRNIMTEKEKMQHQLLYNANCDEVLLAERRRAKEICQEFNQLDPSATGLQEAILKSLLGKTKDTFCILAPFWCDYGYNIEIGEDFFANHNMVILDGGKVTFGDHVFIGPDCGFYTSEHPIDYERRNQGLEYAYPITVGDNVWIGAGVRVMPGVTIGSDVVIGGGSVVVKDIPSHSVAVGNPCRVIRQITEQDRGNCR